MNYVQRGLYRELLDECWDKGFIPDNVVELAEICGCPDEVMTQAWPVLSKCFEESEPGVLINSRLNRERTEKDQERAKRAAAGSKGGKAKAANGLRDAKETDPLASANQVPSKCHIAVVEQEKSTSISLSEPSVSDEESASVLDPLKSTKRKKEPSIEASELAALLKRCILSNKPDVRITAAQLRKWAQVADRMILLDRRDPEKIRALITWVQQDDFWKANVLSMDKLRGKFDQLEMKAAKSASLGRQPSRSLAAMDYETFPADLSAVTLEEDRC